MDQNSSQSNPQNLPKTFRKLKIYTSKLANFTLQWQDLEDHILSIKTQLKELEETYKFNTQQSVISLDNNLEGENEDNATEPSVQSEKDNPEIKIEDHKTKVQPQDKDSESENNDDTTEPANSPPIPVESGKSLLLYMTERVAQRKGFRKDVSEVFKDMSNPGKLVLEALRLFYPSNSIEGDMGVGIKVIRKSCAALLEELMRMVPSVGSLEREEAKRLALDWEGMRPSTLKHSLEVLCFLMLVGVFGLVGEYDKGEILSLFENVLQFRQAPEVFRALGFAHEAPDFIHKLIKQNWRLEAVQFIFAFKLVEKFPPVPLLKEHSEHFKRITTRICNRRKKSVKALENAINNEIAALRGIKRLILKYKLDFEYPPNAIRYHIEQLRNQRKRMIANDPVLQLQQTRNKHTVLSKPHQNQDNIRKQKTERIAGETAPDPVVRLQQTRNKQTVPSKPRQNQNNTHKRRTGRIADETTPAPAVRLQLRIGNKRSSPTSRKNREDTYKRVRTIKPAAAVSNASINTDITIHSKRPFHYQEAGTFRNEVIHIPSTEKAEPATGIVRPSVTAASTIHSMQSSHLQPASLSLVQGVRQMTPSTGFHNFSGLPYVASHRSSSNGLYNTAEPALIPKHMSLISCQHGSGGYAPVNHHLSSTATPYRLIGSNSVRPHMSSSVEQYGTSITRNGTTWQRGLGGLSTPMGIDSNSRSYNSAPCYSGEAGRTPRSFYKSYGGNSDVLPQQPPSNYFL